MSHLTRRSLGRSLGLSLPALALAAPAWAQAWPERPITLVVPFAPGAFTDAVGRFIAGALTPRLGQTVVVENRPGAGGSIAARSVARAPADGYTLMIGTQGINASNASLMRNPGYDPVADFTPIHGIVKVVPTLFCHPSRPWRSATDVIAEAKRRPGQLTFGSSGIGTVQHLVGEMFKLSAGIEIAHVPYRGSSPALADLLAGSIDLLFEYPNPGFEMVRAGKIRPLAVAAPQRLEELPDTPTMAEQGVPDVEAVTWFSLFGPRGLPSAVSDRLEREVASILAGEELREFLRIQGGLPLALRGEAFRDFLASEVTKWRHFAERTGFRID
ncbi:tripartite tricarboxylate transporter substrate binding protein [Belnapia sp. T6]|uniref:Tripartite tricarboxylate transporter substrate binding protein n=1 Tax=Belnapia mucosa TaxID=2804532 RepID=A0ABS1V6Q0_9PROT|nr:tripartite tricarboxylate transporter substrate binding protein [Belnapia mucosa]MBL6457344.1 tripartite tricarboxylate transporter substrate binding protein [Belnapia mucosa]